MIYLQIIRSNVTVERKNKKLTKELKKAKDQLNALGEEMQEEPITVKQHPLDIDFDTTPEL